MPRKRFKTLSVAIPVYNEKDSIFELLSAVFAVDVRKQVIVVDDGSSDGTQEVVKEFAADHDLIFVQHPENRGKGAAVRTAIEHATGELLIVQDGDLEYDPNDYAKLMQPILDGEADVVFGSRRLGQKPSLRRLLTPFYHGVTVLNFLLWLFYGKKVTDEATCYKLFRTRDLRDMQLECERFEFCPEVTGKACRLGLEIKEVPIRYMPRGLDEGKKIGFKDAVEAAMTLWKYRKWTPVVAPLTESAPVHVTRVDLPSPILGAPQPTRHAAVAMNDLDQPVA